MFSHVRQLKTAVKWTRASSKTYSWTSIGGCNFISLYIYEKKIVQKVLTYYIMVNSVLNSQFGYVNPKPFHDLLI